MSPPNACRTARLLVGALSVIAAAAWSAAAYAQEPAQVPPEAAAPPGAAAMPPGQQLPPPPAQPMPPPPPPVMTRTPEPEVPAAHSESDLDVEARRFAIGYSGVSQVPTGTGTLAAPAIGVRYWATPMLGIDLAVGFGWLGGSTDASGTSMDKDSVFGFVLQGGLPLALATHRHVSFQVIPFVTFAHGQTSTNSFGLKTDFTGMRLEVGARTGFELFFGFIGIPELALSATVGLQFETFKNSTTSGGLTQTDTTLRFTTTVQNNPWDIFAGNIAARYYF
jgi:hypothetical protein